MIKFRLYFDKDAQITWLNEMSDKGWALTGFFAGFYTFKPCECGEYRYQVDFSSRFGSVSNEYREFMQEAGIEIVQNWGFWVILRKLASEGEFKLYTDLESSIGYYTKIRRMFKAVAIVEIILLWLEIFLTVEGNNSTYGIGIPGILILTVIVAACIRMVVRTTNAMNQLKEQLSGVVAGKRRMSLLLAAGLLINSGVLLLQDLIPDTPRHLLQIGAIVLMMAGLCSTFRRRER